MVQHIMIITADEYQDQLAANTVRELHRYYPAWYFAGIGGEAMRQAGVEVFMDYQYLDQAKRLQTLSILPQVPSIFQGIKRRILMSRPNLLIVMGMTPEHLSVSRFAKQQGVKVLGVMLPVRWNWRDKDLLRLRESVTHVASVYPFIQKKLDAFCVSSSGVGLPLPRLLAQNITKAQAREALSLYNDKPVIGILPGNTIKELKRFLPLMLRIARSRPQYRFVLAVASNLEVEDLKNYKTMLRAANVWIVKEQTDIVLRASDVVLAANGRVTLEVALMRTPMIVVEKHGVKKSSISRLKYQSLCNLLADREIVPELGQQKASSRALGRTLDKLVKNEPDREKMIAAYEQLILSLSHQSPTARAIAELAAELVGSRSLVLEDASL